MTREGLRLRVNKFRRKAFSKWRKRKLINTDFTIISNNCWAGILYEAYDLPKNSPTVGLYFMAPDYIRFVSNLRYYMQLDLEFIDISQSKYADVKDPRITYPIGRLDDVEIFFLHYKSREEAQEKWERRKKRINYEKLIVKFNDQNMCTEEDIRYFDMLPYKNKICFSVKDYDGCKSVIKINAPKNHEYVRASYEPFGKNKYINLNTIINNL